MDRVFIFDRITGKWAECSDGRIAALPMEKLPVAMLFPYSYWKKAFWCEKHKRFEESDRKDLEQGRSGAGCPVEGLTGLFPDWVNNIYGIEELLARGEIKQTKLSEKTDLPLFEYLKEAYRRGIDKITAAKIRKVEFVSAAVYRWRLREKEDGKIIVFADTLVLLRTDTGRRNGFWIKWELRKVWHTFYIELDMSQGEHAVKEVLDSAGEKLWQNYDWGMSFRQSLAELVDEPPAESLIPKSWLKKYKWQIPDEVADEIFSAEQKKAGKIYGFVPTVTAEGKKVNKLIFDYLERPLDANICQLRYFIGDDYEKLFPRDMANSYKALCGYLKIKPPKSLRKLYNSNPKKVVIYKLLLQLGFRDPNVMRLFLESGKIRVSKKLPLRYLASEDRILSISKQNNDLLNNLEAYCRIGLREKKEEAFGRQLLKILEDGWSITLRDSLMMIHEHWEELSEALKRWVLRDGITEGIHDALAKEVARLTYRETEIKYDSDNYSCKINDKYVFHLVKNTKELYDIGRQVGNCVATYTSSVLEGNSRIVGVQEGGAYCACIELRRQRTCWCVVQALGRRNKHLEGELLYACVFWAKRKELPDVAGHLKLNAEERNDYSKCEFTMKQLSAEDMSPALLTAGELLDNKTNNDSENYFRVLLDELKRDYLLEKISEPEGRQFANEAEHFLYVFPKGENILRAGTEGSCAAQELLGWLYSSGKYMKRDTGWLMYWYEQAAANGSAFASWELAKEYRQKDREEEAKQLSITAARGEIRAAMEWCRKNHVDY